MAALEGLEQRQILPEGRHPGRLEKAEGQYQNVNSQTMTASVTPWSLYIAEIGQSCVRGIDGELFSGSLHACTTGSLAI
jgi:hypothetical protein